MVDFKGEDILMFFTYFLLIVTGYCIAKMFSKTCDGLSWNGDWREVSGNNIINRTDPTPIPNYHYSPYNQSERNYDPAVTARKTGAYFIEDGASVNECCPFGSTPLSGPEGEYLYGTSSYWTLDNQGNPVPDGHVFRGCSCNNLCCSSWCGRKPDGSCKDGFWPLCDDSDSYCANVPYGASERDWNNWVNACPEAAAAARQELR